jgi:hypothetical protein
MNIPEDVRQDADLLTRSDNWLNTQIKLLEEEYSKIGKELGLFKLVLKAKQAMYDSGLVAIHQFMRNENGEIDDMVIKLVKADQAIRQLNKNGNDEDALLYKMGQMTCWDNDNIKVD